MAHIKYVFATTVSALMQHFLIANNSPPRVNEHHVNSNVEHGWLFLANLLGNN